MSPLGRRRRVARRGRRRRPLRRRRITRGTAAILLAGTAAFKLHQRDIKRIEEATKKSAEDLSEEELRAAMQKLGIKKLVIDAGDKEAIGAAEVDAE